MSFLADKREGGTLPDYQKALLLLYIMQRGLPDWAYGQEESVLAKLLDWPIDRAEKAFQEAQAKGMVEKA